jgi:hypothetical protein
MLKPAATERASRLTVAERRAEVARRYPVETQGELADDLGVSESTIANDVTALGMRVGRLGSPRRHALTADDCRRGGLAHRGMKHSPEHCRRIAEAKTGNPRPDHSERMTVLHADRVWHLRWALRMLEGRRRSIAVTPNTWRRYKGALAGVQAGRLGGRTRGYTDEHVARARQLKKLDPNIGRGRLAKQLTVVGFSVTEEQARAILAELKLEG